MTSAPGYCGAMRKSYKVTIEAQQHRTHLDDAANSRTAAPRLPSAAASTATPFSDTLQLLTLASKDLSSLTVDSRMKKLA